MASALAHHTKRADAFERFLTLLVEKLIREASEMTGRSLLLLAVEQMVSKLSATVRGWANYFWRGRRFTQSFPHQQDHVLSGVLSGTAQ